jgi:GTP pyrophosphokinase
VVAEIGVLRYTSSVTASVIALQEDPVAELQATPDWIVRAFSGSDRALVERAYRRALEAHKGQLRASGEPYVTHCIEVARLLAELRLDPHTVSAGLLHDVVEDSEMTADAIEAEFGTEIAKLVDGVTKLGQIDTMSKMSLRDVERQVEAQEAESLRKMFLAMVDDVRVVLIKLADRLHNMRTLSSLPELRRKRIAQETLEIYAPLANRLGIWQMKWELEDLALRHYDHETYQYLAGLIQERREEREAYIRRVVAELEARLRLEGIQAQIEGRPKHIYSIYRKMQRKAIDFDQVFDVRGVRVVVDEVQECYAVLGVVHSLWRPVPGEFDDFVATPKDNLYQSLHTAVIDSEGKTLEVQIRTREMHRHAELGIAAHWRYKEGVRRDIAFENKVAWLRSLMDWRQDVSDAREFLDDVKHDVFEDRVYVFTPRGQVIDLPQGATPIDFAYYVHTEVGHRCRGAKVDGRIVPLSHVLESGNQVEILTTKRGGPSRDWLNPHLGYVRTSRARQKIRQWFRRQDREENISLGREQLDREFKRLGLDNVHYDMVADLFGYNSVDDFVAAVGYGDVSSQRVAARVLQLAQEEELIEEDLSWLHPPEPLPQTVMPEGVRVQGVGNLLTTVARCCNPLPGDPIVGYVTRGRGVSVHRVDCANILRRQDTERLVEVEWGSTAQQTFPVIIKVRAWDRGGLLRDIANVVAAEGVNMSSVNSATHKKDNLATISATLEVSEVQQLITILNKIDQLPNVIEVRRQLG